MVVGPEAEWSAAGIRRFALTYVFCLAAVAVAVALVWEALKRPRLGIDDAYIFFIYARNLAEATASSTTSAARPSKASPRSSGR